MKIARYLVLGLMAVVLAGPGNAGCSCKSTQGTVAADLDLNATPSNLPFGTVALGDHKSLTVTLKHVGSSGTVEISRVSLELLGDDFTFTQPEKTSLAVGEEVTITVTYTPVSATSSYGNLVIEHNVASLGNVTKIPVTANGQVGDILINPNPIDFGSVETGKDKMQDVELTNTGSDSVVLNSISLRLDGSTDFTVETIALPDSKTMPYTLAPAETIGLVLKYAPTGGGKDTSTLVIQGTTQGQYAAWSFDVLGEEMGPHLVASPGQIDFQWVPLNTEAVRLLQIENQGNANLVIPAGGLTLWQNSDPRIVIQDSPTADVTIPPAGTAEFHVSWTPTVALADDGTPIGQLMIASNDLAQSPTPIPVFGRADAPILVVVPDKVDMGFGAQMTPVQRQVTLRNDGHGLLSIGGLSIVDASDTTHGDEFQIAHGTDTGTVIGAFDIAGNAFDAISITFTNKGPDTGCVTATLRILSNYAGHETTDVPISACRSGAPVCNVAIVPVNVNFGTIALGWPKTMPVNIVNIGTGFCSFRQAMITDCPTSIMGGATCSGPLIGTKSKIFDLKDVPPFTQNGLAPGSTTTMTITYNPPASAPIFSLLNQDRGLLSLKVHDDILQKDIVLPKGVTSGTPPTTTWAPNVLGASGLAKISVLPGEVKFGVTTIGCFSRTYKVCIYNSGNAPLTINDVRLMGCTPEFKVKNIPKLPTTISTGAPKCVEAVYAPQDEGPDTCVLQIDATDKSSPTVAVKLSGSGTHDTHQSDLFTQVTGQEVDILFIIDDSGSMSEEQTRLADSFNDFIAQANVWKNDFHLGAISVNVVDEGVVGRLNRGVTTITPRFMTPTSGGSFAKMVDYSSGGGNSSNQESGLEAAQNALSAPLSSDTGLACSTDVDCTGNPNICPAGGTCGYGCIEGTCGGFNSKFLRDNAQLEMVVLSDEEDQSSGGLPLYIDFMKNIKGWYNVDMMHFNAIVGMSGGSAGSCTASDGGTADGGYRYVQAATETHGLTGSVCDMSFAPTMDKIGDVTFHPKSQFFLSRLADPATVAVQVNSKACAAGWRYDAPSNSIIFDLTGVCMPGPGDTIQVDYETLCLTS